MTWWTIKWSKSREAGAEPGVAAVSAGIPQGDSCQGKALPHSGADPWTFALISRSGWVRWNPRVKWPKGDSTHPGLWERLRPPVGSEVTGPLLAIDVPGPVATNDDAAMPHAELALGTDRGGCPRDLRLGPFLPQREVDGRPDPGFVFMPTSRTNNIDLRWRRCHGRTSR
jgi:hypothetical protein